MSVRVTRARGNPIHERWTNIWEIWTSCRISIKRAHHSSLVESWHPLKPFHINGDNDTWAQATESDQWVKRVPVEIGWRAWRRWIDRWKEDKEVDPSIVILSVSDFLSAPDTLFQVFCITATYRELAFWGVTWSSDLPQGTEKGILTWSPEEFWHDLTFLKLFEFWLWF
jgi:hypothetical protein